MPTLSIILLTHATPAHIAGLAHCCKHIPLFQQIPIYATSPVIALGRTLLQDIYSSAPRASTVIPQASLLNHSFPYKSSPDGPLNILLPPPTSDEIAKYFALIHPLKYSQPHQPLPSPFSPPLNDLTITAYNAGHTLGGTIWHVQYGMESIVYAVDWNQVRENVLAGAAWLGGSGGGGAEVIEQLRKPTALVCSAKGAEKTTLAGGRKKRDEMLLDLIRNAVAKGGTVLIPTDSSARALELAYVLEHAWRKELADLMPSPLKQSKLYMASKNGGATMRQVQSMLEWMDENVVKEFESEAVVSSKQQQHKRTDSRQVQGQGIASRDSGNSGQPSSPFQFKHLRMLESQKKIERVMSSDRPRVILASDTSLEWGFSNGILQRIASNPSNLIILTDDQGRTDTSESQEFSLASTIQQWYKQKRDGVINGTGSEGATFEMCNTNDRELNIATASRTSLEGSELSIYQQYLATQRQSQNLSQMGGKAAFETSGDAVDETSSTSSSSSEESDEEKQGKALNVTAKTARFNRNKIEPSSESLGVNILIRRPGIYDYDVREKKGRDRVFPFINKRRRIDDFGDLIKPEDYLRAEERDDLDGQDLRDDAGNKEEAFGKKRKWQDTRMQGEANKNSRRSSDKRHDSKGAQARLATNDLNAKGKDEDSEEDLDLVSDDEPETDLSAPSKLVVSHHSISVNLKIASVDFSGIHDQRSLSMLIPLIQPKKVILIAGNLSETISLANDCRQKLAIYQQEKNSVTPSFIFTPTVGQMVDASVDTNAWTVKLSEALVRRLHWQNVRSLGVVTLVGSLVASSPEEAKEETAKRKKLKMQDDDTEDTKRADIATAPETTKELMPTLDIVPASMVTATRSVAQPIHVGDLRLADLRKILQATGHMAEFRGEGTLLIDGLVAVRKSGTGKIEVENGSRNLPDIRQRTLEGSFYAVKRKIYEGLAVIAGG